MIATDLFIVTFARDFPYLKYCLLSIGKFCKHFNFLRVLVPVSDMPITEEMIRQSGILFPAMVHPYCEPEGKGMLWHMRQIMHADQYTDSLHIAHLDADCIFTEPISPLDFLAPANGKIILRYEPFESICKRHNAMSRWQKCTQACLPFPVLYETMRAHPGVFHRTTYELSRKLMEQATGKSVDDYILSCENAFPQTFCEFNTLGNVAMEKQRADIYEAVCQTSDKPEPRTKLQQFWGHGSIGEPQDIWVKGEVKTVIPVDMMEEVIFSKTYQPIVA